MMLSPALLIALTLFSGCLSEHVSKRQADKEMRIVTIESEPYLMKKRDAAGSWQEGNYEGYMADLMYEVASIVEFSYKFQLVKDGKYGEQGADGTWDGIVGELVEGKADIAAAPLTITSARARVIDFSKPFMNTGITTLFKKPYTTSRRFMWLLEPFPMEVWLLILLITAISCVLYYVLNRLVPAPKKQEAGTGSCRLETQQLCGSVAKLMGIQANQAVWASIYMLTWRTFLLFTGALYICSLTPYAKSSSPVMVPPPYSNIEELASSSMPFGYIAGGSTNYFFQSSTIPSYERIYAAVYNWQPSTMVNSTDEGIKRVQAGRYVLIGESTTLEYATGIHCDLMTVGGNLNVVGYSLATPIGSDLREQINLALLELQEKGQLQKLYNKWWRDTVRCGKLRSSSELPDESSRSSGPSYLAMTLKRFVEHGTLVLLVVGFALTVVAAVSEKMLQRKQQQGNGRNSKVEIIDETTA